MSTPRLLTSGLTGRHYIVTRYKDLGDGQIQATTKFDVTDEVEAIIAARLAALSAPTDPEPAQ